MWIFGYEGVSDPKHTVLFKGQLRTEGEEGSLGRVLLFAGVSLWLTHHPHPSPHCGPTLGPRERQPVLCQPRQQPLGLCIEAAVAHGDVEDEVDNQDGEGALPPSACLFGGAGRQLSP